MTTSNRWGKSGWGRAPVWMEKSGASLFRRSPLRVLVFMGFLAGAGVAPAESLSATPSAFSIDEAVAMAVRDNAELQSLRAKWEAMQEQPAQAGALPNPMFTYSGMDAASGGTWPNTDEKRYMVQQELPWLGKRGLRKGIAVQEAEIMRLEFQSMARDVALEVKESYFDLVAVRQVLAILQEEEAVIRRIEKVAETQYATGERPQADVLSAQTELTLLKQKRLDYAAQENTLQAKLNTFLNRRADAPLAVVAASPPLEFGERGDALFALAATNRPEILAAQAQIKRYEMEKKLMAKESVPDYKLGVEYRDIGMDEDMVMFSVSVDLPIWRSKVGAGVREAEKWRESSLAVRENAERLSALDVQDASFKFQTARRTLDLYRTELIPQAEARLVASEAGYRAGQVDFMDLLESERSLLDARMMAVLAEGAVGAQAARLERATGIGAVDEKSK